MDIPYSVNNVLYRRLKLLTVHDTYKISDEVKVVNAPKKFTLMKSLLKCTYFTSTFPLKEADTIIAIKG